MGKFSKNELRIHLICWLCYIFVEVVLAGIVSEKFNNFFFYVLFYLVNIAIFYFHSLWVMPLLYQNSKNKIIHFLLGLLLAYTLYLIGAALANLLLGVMELRPLPLDITKRYIGVTVSRASLFIMFASGYFYLNRHLERKDIELQQLREIEGLKYQLVIAEKDFLRAQINPHLLFNTLTFIRNAAKNNPENVAVAIVALTELMEYALEDSKSEFIPLAREITQMENLIKLNRLRFEHLLNLNYTKDIQNGSATILPIVLLTLVENMFKHGIMNDPAHPAIIEVISTDSEIRFTTSNLAKTTNKVAGLQSGLRNIKARLDHAYPKNYEFNYGMNGNYFQAQLKITGL
ncbi:Histidine kinase [Pedobacter rhizosphaerae]|uniref:Histidine kinase n=2 Tax=Pedobacter rhizosphaerae TaxID=390241 RepID=A0A1H9WCF3_9SPHI|nr:Histidine kinase [Pedobacter rhizosphaerae]